jgi:hypothetical protein
VRYLQLAHNECDPAAGVSRTKVLHFFGREDQLDRAAISRLVAALSRLLSPEQALAAGAPAGLSFTESRPLGGAFVLDGMRRRLGVDTAIRSLLARRRGRPTPWWSTWRTPGLRCHPTGAGDVPGRRRPAAPRPARALLRGRRHPRASSSRGASEIRGAVRSLLWRGEQKAADLGAGLSVAGPAKRPPPSPCPSVRGRESRSRPSQAPGATKRGVLLDPHPPGTAPRRLPPSPTGLSRWLTTRGWQMRTRIGFRPEQQTGYRWP